MSRFSARETPCNRLEKDVTRHLWGIALFLSLFCAALSLLYATASSPRYVTNFWTDTNLYFTIGRGMTQGLMPYRDLFDHKGPLIFMLYALAAMVSKTSFLGVFLLEVFSLAATLLAAWRIVVQWGGSGLAAIPLTAGITVTCTAFNQGGSAEEFCLPALAWGLWAAVSMLKQGKGSRWFYGRAALFGAAMGWVFAIKYTDCGLFFGLGVCLLGAQWRREGFVSLVRIALAMLAGFLVIVMPVAIFLGACGALKECVEVYFIQNLFEYGGTSMTLTGHLYNALAYLRTQSAANPVVAGLAMLGCAFAAADAWLSRGKGCVFAALAVPVGAGLLLLFCYWGEMAHPYYALVFAALVPLGLTPLGRLDRRLIEGKEGTPAVLYAKIGAVPLLLTLLLVPVCEKNCAASALAKVRREEMPQAAFAEIMRREENPTLLDLTSLDQGFYLAAGITPSCRYFADNNLNTQEKREAIAGYLREGTTQFVVACYAEVGERYELIAEQDGVFDLGDKRHYRLYRRLEETRDGYED